MTQPSTRRARPRIAVVGAGAIGSVIGGFLAKHAGAEVHLLGRPWHLDRIGELGLRVSGIWGEHAIDGLALHVAASEIRAAAPFDWVLVTVKAVDTAAVASLAAELAGSEGTVVSLQNGLGNAERLASGIPPDRILVGRVIFGVEIQPGAVEVTVCADDIVLGGWPSGRPDACAAAFVALLRRGRLPARSTAAIEPVLWSKVIYNCALNPLATLLDCPYGDLLRTEPTRRWMERVVEECYSVAAAGGVHLDPPDWRAFRDLLFGTLIPRTAEHHPSMLQAVRMGKRTEIDALNGEVARRGARLGVAVPTLAALTDLIRARETLAAAAPDRG